MPRILFVCTGNYYRSRFAEEYFNHLAEKNELCWEATSKGLSQNMPSLNNPGPISVHTLKALSDRKIEGIGVNRYPRPMEKSDFANNDRIIAMSEIEHKPMIKSRYLAHSERVEYFEVGDLPIEDPDTALGKIALIVEDLIKEMIISKENKSELVPC